MINRTERYAPHNIIESTFGVMKNLSKELNNMFHNAFYYFVIGIIVTLVSCSRDTVVTSTSEVKSPDGHWVAITETIENVGPGTGDLETGVYLKWIGGAYPRVQILGFSNNTMTALGDSGVRVKWVTNEHLDVTYSSTSTVGFQAVKAGGIEITLRELNKDP